MRIRKAFTQVLVFLGILSLLAGSVMAPAAALSMTLGSGMVMSNHGMAKEPVSAAKMADMSHCPGQKPLNSGCVGQSCPLAMLCSLQLALPLAPDRMGSKPEILFVGQIFYDLHLLSAQMQAGPPTRPPRT
ncbi:MAG: hypothetical protein KGQ46_15060 [Hyphomicrobiales bacterium]|nr:hypothetical protein [Hyphomicrobiales bacterium]MDE2114281.1 hypothetical protein [Hyphomicrobiales bacterium]